VTHGCAGRTADRDRICGCDSSWHVPRLVESSKRRNGRPTLAHARVGSGRATAPRTATDYRPTRRGSIRTTLFVHERIVPRRVRLCRVPVGRSAQAARVCSFSFHPCEWYGPCGCSRPWRRTETNYLGVRVVGEVPALHMRFDRDPQSARSRAVEDCLNGESWGLVSRFGRWPTHRSRCGL